MNANLEVADVFRDGQEKFLAKYGPSLSREQRGVMRDVLACRTAALGGHVERCNDCGHQRIHYNSCRNRHCPKCQAAARAEWLTDRESELLPVPYFHVVFTLPDALGPFALQNKRVVYDLLFRAASETLLQIAADPKHLGARIGFLTVLHTWGQNLMHHPHVHCVVTGGGIAPDAARWVPCKRSRKTGKEFLLPVRVLSPVFRGKFIDHLKRSFAAGELAFFGRLKPMAQPALFEQLLTTSVRKDWVVYAKRPFGGPKQVLKYLARYTHRVAISNQRLVELQNGTVRFRYRDYADGNAVKLMTLGADEFIRRFLLHTLPSGFVRIRYYGFLANRHRAERLDQCRTLLRCQSETPVDAVAETKTQESNAGLPATVVGLTCCPLCGTGRMLIVEMIHPSRTGQVPRPHIPIVGRPIVTSDTS